jgi:hypothetical protein
MYLFLLDYKTLYTFLSNYLSNGADWFNQPRFITSAVEAIKGEKAQCKIRCSVKNNITCIYYRLNQPSLTIAENRRFWEYFYDRIDFMQKNGADQGDIQSAPFLTP